MIYISDSSLSQELSFPFLWLICCLNILLETGGKLSYFPSSTLSLLQLFQSLLLENKPSLGKCPKTTTIEYVHKFCGSGIKMGSSKYVWSLTIPERASAEQTQMDGSHSNTLVLDYSGAFFTPMFSAWDKRT